MYQTLERRTTWRISNLGKLSLVWKARFELIWQDLLSEFMLPLFCLVNSCTHAMTFLDEVNSRKYGTVQCSKGQALGMEASTLRLCQSKACLIMLSCRSVFPVAEKPPLLKSEKSRTHCFPILIYIPFKPSSFLNKPPLHVKIQVKLLQILLYHSYLVRQCVSPIISVDS